jgi:hypothetical protein
MCTHNAEKLPISVLEIWEDDYQCGCDVERDAAKKMLPSQSL